MIFCQIPNLKAKEIYHWWLTRRIWAFRQQKSNEKYLQVSVTNIGKHSGPLRRWQVRSAKFRRCTRRAAKFLHSILLIQHLCKVDFHLVVFGFHRGMKLQGKSIALSKSVAKYLATKNGDFAALFLSLPSFSLEQLSSNGCSFLISDPNCTWFEALDCWLPKLSNDILYA